MGRQAAAANQDEKCQAQKSDKDDENPIAGQSRVAAGPNKANHAAPRSSSQFRIGPPFGITSQKKSIMNSSGVVVKPVILGRIDRGFNRANDDWIGYKRNYLSLVAGFHFEGQSNEESLKSKYSIANVNGNGKSMWVRYFQLGLCSECPSDLKFKVSLVHNTAKRDHGPQSTPPNYNIIPGDLPCHDFIRRVSNIRNNSRVAISNLFFQVDQAKRQRLKTLNPNGMLCGYPECVPLTTAARYDRIQFSFAGMATQKKSTKKYARDEKRENRFIIKIILYAVSFEGDMIEVASSQTPTLIIRGRSPSAYTSDMSNLCLEKNEGEIGLPPVFADAISASFLRGNGPSMPYTHKSFPAQNINPSLGSSSALQEQSKRAQCSYYSMYLEGKHSLVVTMCLRNKQAGTGVLRVKPTEPLLMGDPDLKSPIPVAGKLWENSLNLLGNSFQVGAPPKSVSMNIPSQIDQGAQNRSEPVREVLFGSSLESLGRNSSLSSFERLDKAMRAYETTKIKLSALERPPLIGQTCVLPSFDYSSLPFALYILDRGSTSTPQPCPVPRLTTFASYRSNDEFERCCHGMKKREVMADPRSFDDHDLLSADDSSFLHLQRTLEQYREKILFVQQYLPHGSEDLPLSSIDSIRESFFLPSSLL